MNPKRCLDSDLGRTSGRLPLLGRWLLCCSLLAAAIPGAAAGRGSPDYSPRVIIVNPLSPSERTGVAYDSSQHAVYVAMYNLVAVTLTDTATNVSPTWTSGFTGVTAVVLDEKAMRGYAAIQSGSGSSSVSQVKSFSLNAPSDATQTWNVGPDPVAIVLDATTGRIFTANAGATSLSVIDPEKPSWGATVSLAGNPGAVVADGQGHLYVSFTGPGKTPPADSIAIVDTQSLYKSTTWPIKSGVNPSALAYDTKHGLLYIVRPDSHLEILDPTTGKIAAHAIGSCATGCVYDPVLDAVAIACGDDGRVIGVHADNIQSVTMYPDLSVAAGSRLITCDPTSGRIFVVQSDTCPPVPATPTRPPSVRINSGTFVLTELESLETVGGRK